jgi:lysophospholipase L1-like esterase
MGAVFFVLFEAGFQVARKAGLFGKDFEDVFSKEGMHEGGFLKTGQQVEVINGYGQKVPWATNSKGFRNEQEFNYDKPDNVIRILSLGDSFAAGYRVGQDETYSALLEKRLNESQDSVRYEVMIASVLNPLIGLEYLNKYGLKYQPDIVLLGITVGNDLSQCFMHLHDSGNKRLVGTNVLESNSFELSKLKDVMDEQLPSNSFNSALGLKEYYDKLVIPRMIKSVFSKNYQGESIYAIKGKTPPYVHDYTHGLGMFLIQVPETVHESYEKLESVLNAYANLSKSAAFELHVSIFPQRFQVNLLDQKKTIEDYHLNAEYFDWELPNKIIQRYCDQLNLNLIDPLDAFKRQAVVMYLPNGDMHWNAQGHKEMSKVLFDEIFN